jgi:hypothetical protein
MTYVGHAVYLHTGSMYYSSRSYHELNTSLEPKRASKDTERGKVDVRAHIYYIGPSVDTERV